MSIYILKCLNNSNHCNICRVHKSIYVLNNYLHTIYETHRKGAQRDIVRKEKFRDHYKKWGLFRNIWPEMKKLKQEIAEHFLCDGYYTFEHGDYEYFWKFNDPTTQEKWVVTSDSDLLEGYSTAELSASKSGFARFHGNLSTKLIESGMSKRTGFCSMRSPFNLMAFQRHKSYDWTRYSHIIVRLRGDGRVYHLIVALDRHFDLHWNDQFSYMLFTRGGPYWQTAKIPLSKFYHTHKGRLQDTQEPLFRYRHQVRSLAITIADDTDGEFNLELDYIALVRDENHKEEFAYESYRGKATETDI